MKVFRIHPDTPAFKDGLRFRAERTIWGILHITHGKTKREAARRMRELPRPPWDLTRFG